ncbi:amidohydrolase family protein [Pseudactinotalea sp. Z1739]|uniref:amidohydrolase family protein n=1 Tax=Pseudactinotalea sp. Z1739 TaxID=3413028 RepID=UPI003C7CD6C5
MDLIVRGEVILDGARSVGQVGIADGVLRLDDAGSADRIIEGWAVPGLVDVHCHVGLGPLGEVEESTVLAQARADLAAGTLLVRDAGSPVDTRWLADRDDVPEIIRAGRHLARPKRYLRYFAIELESVDELPGAMAVQARAGDGWVKVVGDWIDRARGPAADLEPLWPDEQLARGVESAHAEGARVTVHTFATETIDPILAAGVDCIEHGTGMSASQIASAAQRQTPVVPTLLQVGTFDKIADQGAAKFPAFAQRMRAMHARRYQHVHDLYEAGVPLLVGTDAGGTLAHGLIAQECAEMVRAGVPAVDVLAAASWAARAYLGRPGIAEGAPADLVVYPADPRADIGVLAHPTAVIRRGRVVG